MKNINHIWKNEAVQVLIITTSLYCSAVMVCDFRTSLYPNHFGTADSFYFNLIRIFCSGILGFGLIQILLHLDDYFAHLIYMFNHPNRWVYYAVRIAFVAVYLKWLLNVLYPFSSEYTELYFILWLAINAAIVLPLIVIITKYKV